jgi:hypothetical protein
MVREPAIRMPAGTARLMSSRAFSTFAPLLGYALFAIVWLGRGVVLHPATKVLGDTGPDKTIAMWSLLWWPHAIAHGHDPFNANVIWAPHGIDLAWVTAVPGASLLLTPITETAGPVVAYNVAALATLALSAWTAYLLARRLTGKVGPSLVAGFVFGFSPYMMGQSVSHLNLTLVFLIPLVGLLAVWYVARDIGPWKYALLLAAVLTLQFYFSTEIFATLTLVGAICYVLAVVLLPAWRRRLVALGGRTVVAYAITGILILPYLLHAYLGNTPPPQRGGGKSAADDLLNLVVPTQRTWIRPPHSSAIQHNFTGNGSEQGGYLGFPLLVIVVLAAIQLRRRRELWVVLLSGLATALLALGPIVRVDGNKIGAGIWNVVVHLPAIGEALPIRLTMYTVLFAGLVCALWLAQSSRFSAARWVLAALAVVALVPNPSTQLWASDVPESSFFDTQTYRSYLPQGDTALVFPYGPAGWSMLWQARTGFRFRMIGGWTGSHIIPAECRWYWDYRALAGVSPPGGAAEFRRFVLSHHIDAVIEEQGTTRNAMRLMAAAFPDLSQTRVGDATVIRIGPSVTPALPKNGPSLRQQPKKRRGVTPVCKGIAPPYTG